MKPPPPAILVDSREQLPYEFDGYPVEVAKINYGDYSWVGYKDKVSVERKSKTDAYQCVGSDRPRFERHLVGLAHMHRPAIVIEASIEDMLKPPRWTMVTAAMAIGSYISWSAQYRIPVFFAGKREHAERITFRFLAAYLKHMAGISPLYGVDSTMRRGAGEGAVTKRRGTRGRPGSKRKLSHRRVKCLTQPTTLLTILRRVLMEPERTRLTRQMYARIAAEEW